MGRVPYLLGSTALFLSQHLIALGIAHHQHLRLAIGPYFWLAPWRPLLEQQFTRGLTFAVLCIGLLIGWLLAVLAFRRARDAWYGSFAACFVFVPLLQLLGKNGGHRRENREDRQQGRVSGGLCARSHP